MSFDALGGAVTDVAADCHRVPVAHRAGDRAVHRDLGLRRRRDRPDAVRSRSCGANGPRWRPWLGTSAYVNYADASLTDFGTAYWGPNVTRLKQVKADL